MAYPQGYFTAGIPRVGLGQEPPTIPLESTYQLTWNPPYENVTWLIPKLSPADYELFRSAFCEASTRERFDAGDFAFLAEAIWGGDDHVVSSACGRALKDTYLRLLEKYQAMAGPAPAPVEQPPVAGEPPPPPPPPPPGMQDELQRYLPYILGGAGLFFLLLGDTRRSRRR